MKKLKFREPYNHHFEYTNDIDRIVKIFAGQPTYINFIYICVNQKQNKMKQKTEPKIVDGIEYPIDFDSD